MEKILGREVSMAEVEDRIIENFAEVFSYPESGRREIGEISDKTAYFDRAAESSVSR